VHSFLFEFAKIYLQSFRITFIISGFLGFFSTFFLNELMKFKDFQILWSSSNFHTYFSVSYFC